MSRMLFLNLPVTDLVKSIDFFTRLGFHFNPQFTDDRAACMVLSDSAFVMLLDREFFATFTSPVAEPASGREAIVAVSAESREEADVLADRALELGGTQAREAQEDGFMYGRSFHDLDGHLWEVIYMDPSAIEAE